MCVIIHVPAGVTPETDLLKRCYDSNHDGWGIMFAIDKELVSFKDVTPFEDFLKFWETSPVTVDRFIHFRIKTHGNVVKHNCHPFAVNTGEQEHLMMHNGIVDVSEIDPFWSDSWHFSKLLSGMYMGVKDFLDAVETQKQISAATIGSRLVFLRQDGTWYKFGTWDEKYGLSFSNLVFDYKVISTNVKGRSNYLAPYYGCADRWWEGDEEYDSWGHYMGTIDHTGETTTSTTEDGYTTITLNDTQDEYKADTFEEGIERIDALIEDADYDDAIAVCQFHSLRAKDITGWYGEDSCNALFDHILDSYTFNHSDDNGENKK